MKKFLSNTKGAITVFVSLLLIPAVLVSGTAVDLSRIHAARSIVQDANQLAANSVLTQYDAMLQDIYGLYGVMESDPILGEMLNNYIDLAVFGEETADKTLGTFQLFYGADAQTTVTPAGEKNLDDLRVLRRQIEEYAKFRVPVIIMKEVWERLETFEKLKVDSEVIKEKVALDQKVAEIDKLYKQIYDLIKSINQYPEIEKSEFENVNDELDKINEILIELSEIGDDWQDEDEDDEDNRIKELEKEYKDKKKDIAYLIKGGGGFGIGVDKTIENSESVLSDYMDKIESLIEKSKAVDSKKVELEGMINSLEAKLENGTCSTELVDGMTKPEEDGGNSIIEEYRALLKYSLEGMANAVKAGNEASITEAVDIIKGVDYGHVIKNVIGSPMISRKNLGNLRDDILPIEDIRDRGLLYKLTGVTQYKYSVIHKVNDFKAFQDFTGNKEFYNALEKMYGNSDANGKNNTKNIKTIMKKVREEAKGLLDGLVIEVAGAQHYTVGESKGESEEESEFGDWGDEEDAAGDIKDKLSSNIIDKFGDLAGDVANKMLLLTYDTQMFSNYTTEAGEKTMSGVKMGPEINYFFQSELEYLYTGKTQSAKRNVATVSGLIFLVRFVFNYTSTFVIKEVRSEISDIAKLSGPTNAWWVREVIRLGYALAESAIDVNGLMGKPKSSVPIFKTKPDQWSFSIRSIIESAIGGAIEGATEGASINLEKKDTSIDLTKKPVKAEDGDKKGFGLYYIDYLRIFLLFEPEDNLALRTKELIQWNMTNVKEGCHTNAAGVEKGIEESVSAGNLFDMTKLHTNFKIESTVDLRMLFLSMPFAQKGVNGVIPQKSIPVTVTDYRGY